MIKDSHFHPTINAHITSILQSGEIQNLFPYLHSLSNAHFRTAGYILGERVMGTASPALFWNLFVALNQYDSRAFLGTTLKALSLRLSQGGVSASDAPFVEFCRSVRSNEVEVRKILQHILPVLPAVADLRRLFVHLGLTDATAWIPHLLHCQTFPGYFLLFHALRQVEHDKDYLMRVACFLMKQDNALSFNFVSLMKAFFGLTELKGTFSLRLEPFEIARLETSYPAFVGAMKF